MQRDPSLAEVFMRIYAVFNSGDASGVDDLVSHEQGIVGIGTDPREWWAGDAVFNAFRAQVPEMHGAGAQFQPGKVEAYSEGSVGWIADQPTLRMPEGGDVPLRLTAVCHREDGAWKMVQFHLSIGVLNEEALGERLTT